MSRRRSGPPEQVDPYTARYYDVRRALHSRTDLNDAVRTVEVNNEFLITPERVSDLRDVVAEDGSYIQATDSNRVSYEFDVYEVTTPASASARTALESTTVAQYRPGSVAVAGIYVRAPTAPVGFAEWGYGREPQTVTDSQGTDYDVGEDGLYWRYESDGTISFVIERAGVETVIPQSAWEYQEGDPRPVEDENGDVSGRVYGFGNVDGSTHATHELAPDAGYVYRIDFAWYGGGLVVPKIVTMDKFGAQSAVDLFAFEPRGQTSFTQPNQPLFARLDNDGTATADSLQVAGRQFSVVGDFEDNFRERTHFEDPVTFPGTEGQRGFLLAFRRKPGYEGVEIGIDNVVTELSNDGLIGELIYADFGGQTPDWEAPSGINNPDETAIEVATQDTGGNPLTINAPAGVIYGEDYVQGGNKNQRKPSTRGPVNFPIPRNFPVAFIGTNITGSSTSGLLLPRWRELW